ncbi:SH3 domain-containing protein [Leptolyngbya sp. BL0902]|uniref:SH3 domain-containing protein n=1 Tax=Leptolyngbya sp. BL0902 TaxID=1115757 RepID=UPI0018E89040|nr:SH3 domain-containing protein [Leptolyngbya sp. BL0902]QQE65777.1 SH3 domain-containing protein [Leptolyngbya sp. BL0902]
MKGFLIGLSKLILGVVIALALLSMAGVATARYFMARLAVLPPKPLYGAELPAPPPPEPVDLAPAAAPEATAPESAAPAEAPPAVADEPAPPAEALPPGSYQAVVSQPIGLIIRSGPGTEHGQVGGVDYNASVVVLEEPANQGWIKVRVVSSGAEGWVKAGNTRRQE